MKTKQSSLRSKIEKLIDEIDPDKKQCIVCKKI